MGGYAKKFATPKGRKGSLPKQIEEVKALILELSQNPQTKGGFSRVQGLLGFAPSEAFKDENFCRAAVSALEKFLAQEGYELPRKLRLNRLQRVTREVLFRMFMGTWSRVSFEEGGKEIFLDFLLEIRNYLVFEETERPLGPKLEEIFDYLNQLPT